MQKMGGNSFASGKVAMVRSYLWYLDNLAGVPFAWDIAALPSYAGTNTVGWSGGMIGVFNTTEHPREAIEVAQALATAPELLSIWGEVPALAHLQPEFFNNLEAQYPEVDFTAAVDGLNYLGRSNLLLPNYAETQVRFDELRDGMMRGNLDLNAEIERLETDLQVLFAGE
jgi:ABC-type glycerol-3-phosphate transport system substrate-binding protein